MDLALLMILQMGNDDLRKEQIRQQAYNRQKAQFSQALNSLSAEEKMRLSTLSKDEQVCITFNSYLASGSI